MQIFHSNNFIGLLMGGEEINFPKDYTKVADIQCDTLEAAWSLSNSHSNPWYENPEVTIVPTEKGGYRSTSVGDIVEDNGQYFLCANIGWIKITPNKILTIPEYKN